MSKEEDPVRLGSMLFTLVEPNRNAAVAYNRWYERDHFYAGCMIGPGILSGRRFVATRALKALRHPQTASLLSDVELGSYLALYFVMAGEDGPFFDWATKQVNWLHENGRMFTERRHIHTMLYDFKHALRRDTDGVPPALALDHPFAGLAAVMTETDPADDAWMRDHFWPGRLRNSPIALVLSFRPRPLPKDAPSDVPRDAGRHLLQLCFLDTSPDRVWQETFAPLGAALAETGRGRLLLAAPFIPTIPGTDTYTDQLW